jgi:hypothetical protein
LCLKADTAINHSALAGSSIFGVTAAAAAAAGIDGEQFATIERALDERTIGHNPERLNLMKVRCFGQQF